MIRKWRQVGGSGEVVEKEKVMGENIIEIHYIYI
jgi:hypothetical protein